MPSTSDQNGKPVVRGRPFAKGNSGRKPGSRNNSTLVAEALLQGEMEGLVRAAIKLAMGGHGPMLKFFLGRRLARDRAIQLDLPEIHTPEDVVEALNVIARAVSEGEITPSEGAALTFTVESLSRTIEVMEKRRLIAISRGSPSESVPADYGMLDVAPSFHPKATRLWRLSEPLTLAMGPRLTGVK